MFHSRRTSNKINRLHGEPLELFMMTMSQLLINFLPWTNLSVFTIKLSRDSWLKPYKALHDTSGNSLKELFVKREITISLRSKPELVIPSLYSALKGKNFLRYFGSVIWNQIWNQPHSQLKLGKIIRFRHL